MHIYVEKMDTGLIKLTVCDGTWVDGSRSVYEVTAETPIAVAVDLAIVNHRTLAAVPYPGFCRHPDKCAGKNYCQSDPTCID